LKRLAANKNLLHALLATVFFGAAGGILASTMNNFLSDVHQLDAASRGWLEFPRELPGFLMLFIAGAMLVIWTETRIAALAMFFMAAGALGFAFHSPSYAWLVAFTIIGSVGDHIIFTVEGPIGLRLAKSGKEGRRLGQFGGARNLGTIAGVAVIYAFSKLFGDNYAVFYSITALCSIVAGVLYFRIRMADEQGGRSRRFVFKRKYSLFYAISALFGVRKQIFIVFGAWVLIKVHGVPVSTMALLFFVAAALGVVFRPLLGDIIDWAGERAVLVTEEFFLLLVCLAYAFSSDLLPKPFDLWLLYATYVLDSVLFALRIARTTYLKKIADHPSDITPTLAVGLTIDHVVSMLIPILSGYIWVACGFRWVFVLAAVIALGGMALCARIPAKLPAS